MRVLAEILRRLLNLPAEQLRRIAERLREENGSGDTGDSGSAPKNTDSDNG